MIQWQILWEHLSLDWMDSETKGRTFYSISTHTLSVTVNGTIMNKERKRDKTTPPLHGSIIRTKESEGPSFTTSSLCKDYLLLIRFPFHYQNSSVPITPIRLRLPGTPIKSRNLKWLTFPSVFRRTLYWWGLRYNSHLTFPLLPSRPVSYNVIRYTFWYYRIWSNHSTSLPCLTD